MKVIAAMAQLLDRKRLRTMWDDALLEDGAHNDVTSLVAVSPRQVTAVRLVSREKGTFAGTAVLDVLREAYPTELTVTDRIADGAALAPATLIAELAGSARRLLAIERTLLNFLQRLCGVATATRACVDAVAGTGAEIYDTRKTVPGWRQLDKYAVRCGGGRNHRMGLHDAVLVKDNHLAGIEPTRLRAGVADLVAAAAALAPPPQFIEIEVDNLGEFDEIVAVPGIDVILLDNFTPADMRKAVARRDARGLRGKLQLEASGGLTLARVAETAATGVERIAIGAITHSARTLDLALDLQSS
ncbi:MAG: carboxylating nicotinate-nucleotide diphosphorylase [Planctomycetes bacterium]|nr:carboxylating nicotinate-nucleotide diphosphorylase [Planctomycetota bacterium]